MREQAFWVLRNLAENDAAAALVMDGMGRTPLVDALAAGMEASSADVALQVRLVPPSLSPYAPSFFISPVLLTHLKLTGSFRIREPRQYPAPLARAQFPPASRPGSMHCSRGAQ